MGQCALPPLGPIFLGGNQSPCNKGNWNYVGRDLQGEGLCPCNKGSKLTLFARCANKTATGYLVVCNPEVLLHHPLLLDKQLSRLTGRRDQQSIVHTSHISRAVDPELARATHTAA